MLSSRLSPVLRLTDDESRRLRGPRTELAPANEYADRRKVTQDHHPWDGALGTRPLVFALFTLLSLGHISCSDMKSRPEKADKLKPILVEVNTPTAAEPTYQSPVWGDKVRLDFHFIAPTDLPEISAQSNAPTAGGGGTEGEGEDEATSVPESPYANLPIVLPVPNLVLIGSPIVDKTYPGLQHIIVRAEVQLPTTEVLLRYVPAAASRDFVRFRYSMSISDGTRTIPVEGDFPAYRDRTVTGADWNLLASGIVAPVSGADTGLTVDIKSEIVNPQDEAIKIAWFASDGEIKNRRASDTEWKLPGAGQYTLVFTVRGKKSRSGTLGFRTINAP